MTSDLTKVFVLYIVLKLTVGLATLVVFNGILGLELFKYPDFGQYQICRPETPNALFSYSVCILGLETIAKPIAIVLAVVINTLRDVAYIILVHRLIGLRGVLLFTILLASHPFLALYHERFVTSMFASLGVLFVFYREVRDPGLRQYKVIELICALTLITFRYTNMLLFLTYGIVSNWKRPRVLIIILLLGCALVALSWNYLVSFVDPSSRMALSPGNIISNVHVTGFDIPDFAIGLTLYLVSHAVFLTGFREAAYLQFPEYFLPITTESAIEFFLYMVLSVFHLVGLGAFFWRFWNYRTLCVTVIITLAFTTIFIVHLRYFIQFMPITLLGYAAWYASPKSLQPNTIKRQ